MTDIKTENEVVLPPEVIKSMTENYEALKAIIEALNQDFEKFNEKKVKAAGARVRNNLLNCKKLCDKLRKQVLADIKALPIKHRKGTDEEGKDYEKIETDTPLDEENKETSEHKQENKEKKPRKPRRANKKKPKEITSP